MYRAPTSEIAFVLKHVAGLKTAMEAGHLGDLSEDLVDAVLEEAGKFASERIAPLNTISDQEGATLKDGVVTMPTGFKEVYKDWAQAGWNGLGAPEIYGGQGLPYMMSAAAVEIWCAACQSFALGPILTVGAVEALHEHGDEKVIAMFAEKIVSGEWMGTMNLTEPQAGTDLAALKSTAEPVGDGTYKITGQKIFISFGDHELTDNICHLVLARLPDAPEGVKGISLFMVPKYHINEDGSLGGRNDVFCQSLEHKLGLHGSPTCVMIFGDGYADNEPGAIGYIVGGEHKGLNCMFTMMNNARLNVGLQGVAISEAAYQKALQFANERLQGKAIGQKEGMTAIVNHPDVARNLLNMKSHIQAARGICYSCAHALDMAAASEGDDKKFWDERAGFITPIAKAFSTDIGVEVTSLGVQVHGGMGYIEETGAAQYMRDARINTIYEGTNGVQAIDLVMRKLGMSGGESMRGYLQELRDVVEQVRSSNRPEFGDAAQHLEDALNATQETSDWILEKLSEGKVEEVLSGATPFLRLWGLASGGVYLAKGGLADSDSSRAGLARYFAENHLAECRALKSTVTQGAQSLMAIRAELAE
ncbi:MAG: acyl-CoA dehydrogenase [Hyphomicrobiales bacterium]|nr:acyl-CoA dehydrogenase [Hyphomicrobiales bacterium]PCH50217.1 MAG: acyl-CoA dehydrogenase [Hyphomicrobiales bacterium]